MTMVPVWYGLKDHISSYDLIICDLWGVMHNGLALFPEAVEAILNARNIGVQTCFLTNAPKPASIIRTQLADKKLPENLLDNIVSSGSQARTFVKDQLADQALYHMGPDMDHQAVEGLPVSYTRSIDTADFIFASGLDFDTAEEHRDLLQTAFKKKYSFLMCKS